MKMKSPLTIATAVGVAGILAALALTSCSSAPAPQAVSPPHVLPTRPAVAPPPSPVQNLPPPAPSNWIDAPQTNGDWTYRREGGATIASFGAPGANTLFVISCDLGSRRVELARAGRAQGQVPMLIRTETISRNISAAQDAGGQSFLTSAMSSQDRLLDAMAFSRGRFAVEVPGLPSLYVPAWPEISRVIEDCR